MGFKFLAGSLFEITVLPQKRGDYVVIRFIFKNVFEFFISCFSYFFLLQAVQKLLFIIFRLLSYLLSPCASVHSNLLCAKQHFFLH